MSVNAKALAAFNGEDISAWGRGDLEGVVIFGCTMVASARVSSMTMVETSRCFCSLRTAAAATTARWAGLEEEAITGICVGIAGVGMDGVGMDGVGMDGVGMNSVGELGVDDVMGFGFESMAAALGRCAKSSA